MLDDSTSNDKTFAQPQQQPADSITEVDFSVGGPRTTCTFKGNRKLWKAFVSYSKVNYGSVCHIIEPFEIAVLTSKVNLSNTIRPLHIENLNVERAVKRVRRYGVEVTPEVVDVGKCAVCGEPGYVRAIEPDGCRILCKSDFVKVKSRLVGWKVLVP